MNDFYLNMHDLLNWSLDCIFPKYCIGCKKEGFYVCQNCLSLIPILSHANCFLCGRRSPNGHICNNCNDKFHPKLKGLLVASDWNNLLLRQIIYTYKYKFIKELSEPLSYIMIKFLETIRFNNCKFDELVLIPVPLNKKRLIWRGYNQAEFLAQKISEYYLIPVNSEILKRSRSTLPQVEIKNRNERQKNILGAFKINENMNGNFDLKNKIVILVDDVCTTSATLEECANVLKPLKPKEIFGLVIARG